MRDKLLFTGILVIIQLLRTVLLMLLAGTYVPADTVTGAIAHSDEYQELVEKELNLI